jgi:hypothetical protein
MSSTNKSSGASLVTLLVALALFLVVAGGSWYYFTQQKTSDEMSVEEQLEASNEGYEDPMQTPDMSDQHDHGHDHGHSHDHGTTADAGEDGTIYDHPSDPILGERGVGDKNAPIQIREYFSLTCNHCASFHETIYQQLKTKYIDTGKVYLIYEEFPLNGPALYGSMIARCLPEERYAGFIDILLRNQEDWAFSGDFKGALKQNAALAGMNDEEFEECFNDKQLQAAIAANIKEATDNYQVSSTPTFVFNNGQKIIRGGKPIESFDAVIAAIENAPTAESSDTPMEVEGNMNTEDDMSGATEEAAEDDASMGSDDAEKAPVEE